MRGRKRSRKSCNQKSNPLLAFVNSFRALLPLTLHPMMLSTARCSYSALIGCAGSLLATNSFPRRIRPPTPNLGFPLSFLAPFLRAGSLPPCGPRFLLSAPRRE